MPRGGWFSDTIKRGEASTDPKRELTRKKYRSIGPIDRFRQEMEAKGNISPRQHEFRKGR